ncbi:hypothetical protein QBC46DRAFT_351274 [Diplogelasinospora grovesii]|uniref:Uncharacterized protein n=1 Tax=Diplogelasinospora grovesii TaxID=303347 RepID=A0AAN6NDY7_9PEZI|nr:hypothetical protein QBC46DRAFT_351274 [Diplogelasinospora grovesii]
MALVQAAVAARAASDVPPPVWNIVDASPRPTRTHLAVPAVADQGILLGYETEHLWKHSDPAWGLHLLPDPRDGNVDGPERDAVMASFLEDVVRAFNWCLTLGLRGGAPPVERAEDGTAAPFIPERCPDWVASVPPLPERLVLHEVRPELAHLPIPLDDPYLKRNIDAGTGYLTTV